MRFAFDIRLTDEDYLNYNIFWMLRSPYGKKEIVKFRLLFTAVLGILCFLFLLSGGFSKESLLGVVPYLIAFLLVQALTNAIFTWSLKRQIKSLKKKGKMGYSPTSEMVFFEDSFTETTPDKRIEEKYTSIERISILSDKVIYIHVNNVMSYIVPMSCFSSREEGDAFLGFLKEKCQNIDTY